VQGGDNEIDNPIPSPIFLIFKKYNELFFSILILPKKIISKV